VILKEVEVHYETQSGRLAALGPINLTLRDNEILSIVGPSGCGKSTLAKVISGVVPLSKGQLVSNSAAGFPPRVFPVFQDYGVFPWLTVGGNAEFGLETLGLGREEIRQRSDQWLGRLGLSGVTKHFPYSLSGGMRQRVGLARAFASGAEILLLDEPFSAVDEITRDSLQEILLKLLRETNGSAILITHSIDEAIKLGDRLIVMNGPPGHIVSEWDCRAFSIGDLNQTDATEYMTLHAKVKKAIGETRDSASPHQLNLEVMDGHG